MEQTVSVCLKKLLRIVLTGQGILFLDLHRKLFPRKKLVLYPIFQVADIFFMDQPRAVDIDAKRTFVPWRGYPLHIHQLEKLLHLSRNIQIRKYFQKFFRHMFTPALLSVSEVPVSGPAEVLPREVS